jgi:hypothetical protein
MFISELETFARSVLNYLTSQVFCPDGSKNSYQGNIPINLAEPANMGEKANEICHPVLRIIENSQISWMQLLASLNFIIIWQDDIPNIVMHYNHNMHSINNASMYPSCINCKTLQTTIENIQYNIIHSLLKDIFGIITAGLTNMQGSLDTKPECICLLNIDSPKDNSEYKPNHADVER